MEKRFLWGHIDEAAYLQKHEWLIGGRAEIQNWQSPKAIVPLGTLLAGWRTGKPSVQRTLLFNLFDALIVKDGQIEGWTPRHDAGGEIAKLLDAAFPDQSGAAYRQRSGRDFAPRKPRSRDATGLGSGPG